MDQASKLQKIRDAMTDDDWDKALKIAASFQRLGEHKEAIEKAASAVSSPNFYRSLGEDIDKLKSDGIAALKSRFNKSWEESQRKKNGA
ncbi:hypothetical protein [Spirosoma foliorum]|uniref:Uncharacterized protein n=1 Tax=Spirosoma foliorum TaxID=2710596 RepID=A0A7G5GRJ7_9BACT|nr:hypothetical protein [Spirosoma foliorum]QMW01489.1 hypothetical protein H3H32_26535 [Spirosoma foliorum]